VGAVLKNWRRWAFEALAILAIVVVFQLWQGRGLPEGPAPALTGTMLDGRPASLADTVAAAGGKPVLVAFWATWCSVCKAEAGNLDAIARDTPLLAVATSSGDTAEIKHYLDERGRRLQTINDADGQVAASWKVIGLPTHFVIDGHGNVRFRVVGYATEWGLRARLWWAQRFQP
jgi:thiol-disulfide isomerase/thioredoxin